MNKREFIQERQKIWKEFEQLIHQFDQKSFRKTSARDITTFSQLFRELANDLAIVRAREWDQQLEDYLNNLAARGHNAFYRSPMGRWKVVLQYLTVDFPQLFRSNIAYFLLASFFFFGPLLASWIVVQQNPALASRVLPDEQLEMYEQMYSSKKDDDGEKQSDWGTDSMGAHGQQRAMMAGFYINNNVGIALRTFAVGAGYGVFTVLLLLYNGILIGVTAGYLVSTGHGDKFLSFVVTHGSFELTAIAVAGGAGLMLADSLIRPKDRTLLDSLLVRGREAVQIAFGAGVMLVIAAFIEGFWSPAPIPAVYKYTVGASMWLLVALYLGCVGWRR